MTKLTPKARKELKVPETQMKIAIDCHRSLQTVANWIKHGHDNLTKRFTIDTIIKHTSLTESEIFEL